MSSLIAAPMAGGPTTVALAAAVAASGGLPFLAAGYQTPAALEADIRQLRRSTSSFGVNLFAPGPNEVDPAGRRITGAGNGHHGGGGARRGRGGR